MDSIKFHQLVTKTGIISLAALAVIGILATFVGVCEIDLDFLPDCFEGIFLFTLSMLSILTCFCWPVSFLMTLISSANSLRNNRKSREEE